MRGLISLIC
jgi:pre-mRNA-splicing helicase BRR2